MDCYSTSTVVCTGGVAGGLIGDNGGSVIYSYADPDGDDLSYTWSWAARTVSGGEPNLVIPLLDLAHGQNTVTLIVSDGMDYSEPQTISLWVDRAPVAKVSPDGAWVDPSSASFAYLRGTGSGDPDGDPISYLWSWQG